MGIIKNNKNQKRKKKTSFLDEISKRIENLVKYPIKYEKTFMGISESELDKIEEKIKKKGLTVIDSGTLMSLI